MPYIKRQERMNIMPEVGKINGGAIENPGQLNYAITELLDFYLHKYGKNYQIINDIIGALEGAKLEFYRRVAESYEDRKIKENGDVYSEE